MLASGFLWLSLEETLNHWLLLPVRELDHILVSVNAFRWYVCTCLPVYLSTYSVGGIGLEPTTFAMSTRCSNQLSYPPESDPHYTDCPIKWQSLHEEVGGHEDIVIIK